MLLLRDGMDYRGADAVWRSIASVLLLALIGKVFNILNLNPFFKDLTTGIIVVVTIAGALAINADSRRGSWPK